MTTSVLIQQGRDGSVLECSSIVEKIKITTNRSSSAGKMELTMLEKQVQSQEGDTVRFSVDGKPVFLGYIFAQSRGHEGKVSVTCYDQLRYLKANQSYAFVGMSADRMIARIAADFGLSTGLLEDTGYILPTFVQENKSCLDIIGKALQLTTQNMGKIFVFYDDVGALTLRCCDNLKRGELVGAGSLATDYTYKTDIDAETYNTIKLVRPNSQTGKGDTYIVQDEENMRRWGKLQYYATVDEELNPAQIAEMARTMLYTYNRILRTVAIKSLGIVGLRAGEMLLLHLPGIAMHQYVVLDKVSHTFQDGQHTMELETRTLGWETPPG